MNLPNAPIEDRVRIALTPTERYGKEYSQEALSVISPADTQAAADFARLWPAYQPTPLLEDEDLADDCGVASVLVKHEGYRAPTRSFKVLGPPYALARQLLTRLSLDPASLGELIRGNMKSESATHTACAATSGNHGRALAWAAAQLGCPCRIYMPQATGAYREEQIQQFGAETVRVEGNYDDAVERAVVDAQRQDLILVGDGARSESGVLRHIIHGYSVVGEELVQAIGTGSRTTHVLVPAGSGSLAAGVTARLWMAFGVDRPKVVVVQPHSADAAYQSCLHGLRRASQGNLATVMDGLSVRELSADAWPVLRGGAFAMVTIPDNAAISVLRHPARVAEPTIGETGVTALAGLYAIARDANAREQLLLDQDSRVVLVATEGVTDPPVLNRILSDDTHCGEI